MDSYAESLGFKTFYIVGEWFLGFIIIFYIIYPLLRLCINKYPKATIIVTVLIYLSILLVNNSYIVEIKRVILLTRLPEILFGILLIKYKINVKWYHALLGLLVMILNTILKPTININLQVTYVGISAFLFLMYISKFFDRKYISGLCGIISKYSYPIFIIHHVIMILFTIGKLKIADINNLTYFRSYMLFIWCCIVTMVFSFSLFHFNNYILKFIDDILKKLTQRKQIVINKNDNNSII